MANPTPEYLSQLVKRLCALSAETEWVEFKESNWDPQEIGEYVSALANSAVLANQPIAFMVWGVADESHEIVGTTFRPAAVRKGNELLENWLTRLLTPAVPLQFHEVTIDAKAVVVLEIGRAFSRPVRFSGQEYVRVGSYKKRLADLPEKERLLWRAFEEVRFEDLVAADHLAGDDVLRLLDYPAYFDLLRLPLPESRDGVLRALQADNLIRLNPAGEWCITNLGAALFARHLGDFPAVRRKACRVIFYRGTGRITTIREHLDDRGYASGFEGLLGFIIGLLPSNEVIHQALRKTVPAFPSLAVRELIANALIHQDFSVTGAGPMVEVFDDRMEISNPGIPLIATERFLDNPPRSRNEVLASLMRRIGICEERGSGIDKVVFETEVHQLPAPMFEVGGEATRAVLFSPRPLGRMTQEDRIRACYLHACLRYVNRDFMTNTTLRERFGIDARNSATASRYIREALNAGVIKPYDEAAAKKLMKYVPYWA